MNAPDPNRRLLLSAVEKLVPLLDRLVFVGGCATGMLITDPGAAGVRVTRDVDVIVGFANPLYPAFVGGAWQRESLAAPVRKSEDVDTIARLSSYPEFTMLEEQLRKLGFSESREEGAPVCRWVHGDLILDVMPTDPSVLGFSNRWYGAAYENARKVQVGKYEIRLIRAPHFLATKLEAFLGRGASDYSASRDLEDIIAVIDGRSEIIGEVRLANPDLQEYLSTKFRDLLANKVFVESLPGFLLPDAISQQRISIILERINLLIGDK
jgi:hypothetical protein